MEHRFDLGAKYIFVKSVLNDIKSTWPREVYTKHMKTMNGFWEFPGTKIGEKQFLEEFVKLIDNMKQNGFDKKYVIPIGKNKLFVNGSHRIVTAITLGKTPLYKGVENDGHKFNFNFFLNRGDNKPNLDKNIADFIALENIKFINKASNNRNFVRTIVLYPSIWGHPNLDKITSILNEYGTILYQKVCDITKNGVGNLISEIYRGEDWIGGMYPKICSPKLNPCWRNGGKTQLIVYFFNDPSKDIEMKSKLRGLFRLGKHSLHITDYFEDTWRVASSLLNENSLYFLNHGGYPSSGTQTRLSKYFLEANQDDFCVTSSTILDMYGLRGARDLDYLGDTNIISATSHKGIWLTYYDQHHHEIIYNPSNHFYFNGFKFATPEIIKKMKEKRAEAKDIRDIELINSLPNKTT